MAAEARYNGIHAGIELVLWRSLRFDGINGYGMVGSPGGGGEEEGNPRACTDVDGAFIGV